MCCSNATCVGGIFSSIRDDWANSCFLASLTLLSSLVLQYNRTTNRSIIFIKISLIPSVMIAWRQKLEYTLFKMGPDFKVPLLGGAALGSLPVVLYVTNLKFSLITFHRKNDVTIRLCPRLLQRKFLQFRILITQKMYV